MPVPAPDRPAPGDPQTLVQVEQTIASGVRTLRFDGDLERRYEADTQQRRLEFLTAVGIGGALVYNLFLISDWLTLRDMFGYRVVGRLCLITPMIIGSILLARRVRSRWALETIAAAGSVLCLLVPLAVMVFSTSPYRLHYQLGMLLIMVYCAMIQQLPLRYATVALMCMLVIQVAATYLGNLADVVIWQSNALLFTSAALLLLMASYFLERDSRLSYLFALRGRLLQVQLMELARIDALTQLYNRRYQGEVVTAIWQRAADTPVPVAVILVDIDHFKAYNDGYGHLQGDACLQRLSLAVQRVAEDNGALAFRFGGEELLVLQTNADADRAKALGQALQAAVAALAIPHPVLGPGGHITISLGIAAAIAPRVSADALIGSADDALYAAKAAGRNRLHCA